MKLASSLAPWLALALGLSAFGSESNAVPTNSISQSPADVGFHHISAERLTHSTPRRMDGFQRMLERRYKKQQQRAAVFNSQQSPESDSDAFLGQAWSALRTGLSSQQSIGSTLAQYVEYITADVIPTSKNSKHNITEPAYYRQPLDHFDNTTQAQFDQRFFYSTRHYKPASARKDGEA
ncbi:hypothetical protein, partial [Sporisorium scitamineum]